MRYIVYLAVLIMMNTCGHSNSENVRMNQELVKKIAFSENYCDYIAQLDSIVLSRDLDAEIMRSAVMVYRNCELPRKAISVLKLKDQFFDMEYDSYDLRDMMESYRSVGNFDSALFYLDLLQSKNDIDFWNSARVSKWRFQIYFESGRFDECIEEAKRTTELELAVDSNSIMFAHQYIALSLYNLNRISDYCLYSRKFIPKYFSVEVCDSLLTKE